MVSRTTVQKVGLAAQPGNGHTVCSGSAEPPDITRDGDLGTQGRQKGKLPLL